MLCYYGETIFPKYGNLVGVIEHRGLLAETPEHACIIVSALPYKEHCVAETPTWGEGKNHLLVDVHDENR